MENIIFNHKIRIAKQCTVPLIVNSYGNVWTLATAKISLTKNF